MNYNQQNQTGANYNQAPQYQTPPQPNYNYNNYKKPSTVDMKKLFQFLAVATSFLSFAFFFLPMLKLGSVSVSSIAMFTNEKIGLLSGFAYFCLIAGIVCSVATIVLKNRMINIGTISAMGLSLLLFFISIVTLDGAKFGVGFFLFLLSTAASITFSSLLLAKK